MSYVGFNNSISGMRISERGLGVAGHNIANIATKGYSKQQLISRDSIYSNLPGTGQIGLGVDVDELRQLRDSFLDINYRNENSSLGYWNIKNTNIEEIQTILAEPYGDGLQKAMDEFWNGWQELSKEPDNLTTRALLRQKAGVMINSFNHIQSQLNKLQSDINKEIILKVDRINDIAKQITDLNMLIKTNEFKGDNANDYRDKRNVLLDELSKIVEIQFTETSDHLMNVTVGSILLVNGVNYNKMVVKENVVGSSYLSPAWENTGQLVNVKNGELKGYLEVRGEFAQGAIGSVTDGSPDGVITIDEKQIIPSIKERLNELLYTMASNLNAVHRAGYGIGDPPTTGIDFFTTIDPSKPFEMGNIQVNPALVNLNLIAASTTMARGDGTNAQNIIDIRNLKLLGSANDPLNFDEFYRDTMTSFGIRAQEAMTMSENQNHLLESISNKRDSISGVNLDEEMADILKYQHAYQANVRILNVIDSMLNKIINDMLR